MLEEVVGHWITDKDGIYVDATLGGGGHAEALLDRLTEQGCLIGIDRDEEALAEAAERLRRFGDRVILEQGTFSEMGTMLKALKIEEVSGVLFDLGVSSHQIDRAGRGFSYRQDGPLDMRMGQTECTRTAADVVNSYSEQALFDLFRRYGEERWSRRIARRICTLRNKSPFERTSELREAIVSVIPGRAPQKTLARIFQALRIEVNDEIGELERGLEAAISLLSTGGRLAVLSYHSLEDRTVKAIFRKHIRGCHCPPGFPVCVCGGRRILKAVGREFPSTEAIARNERARSARLRVVEKTMSNEQ
jgi:16S rRNA (cytosine1402-N4)-methyltransferase